MHERVCAGGVGEPDDTGVVLLLQQQQGCRLGVFSYLYMHLHCGDVPCPAVCCLPAGCVAVTPAGQNYACCGLHVRGENGLIGPLSLSCAHQAARVVDKPSVGQELGQGSLQHLCAAACRLRAPPCT